MSYEVRRATLEDTPQIVALLSELLGDATTKERHTWLYEQNPHGKAITWLATEPGTGKIVGCTSFFPRKLWVKGRLVQGALGGDGYVLPAFRRKGIAAEMHNASRRDMPHLGIEVMFGTPMPANFTPLKRAGGRDVADVRLYVKPISGRVFGLKNAVLDTAISKLLAPKSHARLEPLAVNDARADEIWRKTRDEIGLGTVRDAAFLTWRFVSSPTRRQKAFVVMDGNEPLGVCALEYAHDTLRIIDMVVPGKNWGRCFSVIAYYARGSRTVEMRMSEGHARANHVYLRGFLPRGKARPLNIVLPEAAPLGTDFIDDSLWYVTWAETDRDSTVD